MVSRWLHVAHVCGGCEECIFSLELKIAARRMVADIGGVGATLFAGLLADAFNPGVPFLVYAPLLMLSTLLLAVVSRETLER